MESARFRIRPSQPLIPGQAGLVFAGQALARFAQLPQQLDPTFPVRGVFSSSRLRQRLDALADDTRIASASALGEPVSERPRITAPGLRMLNIAGSGPLVPRPPQRANRGLW